jgi:ADP-heptose:LPS heptosyltransferase
MRHGLGDNAQFSIVMRHIAHYFPHWNLDIEVGSGKESYFLGKVGNIFRRKIDQYESRSYDEILDILWPIPKSCCSNLPSTKPTQFLKHVLKVKPIEKLYEGYDITIQPHEHQLADDFIKTLPDKPFVLIHYLAKTLKTAKSLTHADARFICKCVKGMNCTPVILDWKKESPLPDNKTIFNPDAKNPIWGGVKNSSAGTLAALIGRAKLYVGIDSGPLHVAGTTTTPSIGVWHKHHPINFFDICDNVMHLVPLKNKIKGFKPERATNYFEKKYRHIYYTNLKLALAESITELLQKP